MNSGKAPVFIHKTHKARRCSAEMRAFPPLLTDGPDQKLMFNQIFIFGAHPNIINANGNSPILLSMFPSTGFTQTDEDIQELINFCFPEGFEAFGNESHSNPSSTDVDNRILSEFVFYIDKPSKPREYCICVRLKSQNSQFPFFSTNINRKYPFSLCMVSSVPYLSSHFQFVTYLSLFLLGKVSIENSGQPFRPPFPPKGLCHPSLIFDKRAPLISLVQGLSAPSNLIDQLLKYMYIPTDRQNDQIIDNDYCHLVPFYVPVNLSTTQNLSFPSMDVLFSYLCPSMICSLYYMLLLEKRILIVSRDPHKFSLAVIALASLMRPFKLTNTDIFPVVHNRTYLTANRPYLAGSPTANQSTAEVICDLDKAIITDKHSFDIQIPTEIVKKLEMVIKDRENEITVPPKNSKALFSKTKNNPEFVRFFSHKVEPLVFPPYYTSLYPQKYVFQSALVDSIREIFASHFAIQLSIAVRSSIKDIETENGNVVTQEMDYNMFSSFIDKRDSSFFRQFVNTSIFTDFVERTKSDLKAMRAKHRGRSATFSSSQKYNVVPSPTDALSPFHNTKDGESD